MEHPQPKAYQLKSQILQNVEIIKFKLLLCLKPHWKGLDLELLVFDYHQYHPQVKIYRLKPQTFKHVEVIESFRQTYK